MGWPLTLPLGETAMREAIRREAQPRTGDRRDYDALSALVGDARIVLLGEASHGTHEFYRERARITRMLIAEHGFDAVAIEGDWPDAYRVNRYVRGEPGDGTAEEALRGFRRFPTWMWHNDTHRQRRHKAGFYGLDLYSLTASMEAVVAYLETHDHAAAARARRRYECLQAFAGDGAAYGQAVLHGARSTTARCSATAPPHGTCATATWPTRWTSCWPTSTAGPQPPASSCGRTTRTSATRARRT